MLPTRILFRPLLQVRRLSTTTPAAHAGPFVRIPSNARVYPFGTANVQGDADAILRFPPGGMTINSDGNEGWAIVGDANGRKRVVETLLGRHRITPLASPPGPLPVNQLNAPARAVDKNSWQPVRYLAFAKPSSTGEFVDYTARYGHLEEDDAYTLRHTLLSSYPEEAHAAITEHMSRALESMRLEDLIDLPAVALSSGQTRRARIAAATITDPEMLVLEDPMAGLDVGSRELVTEVLGEVNAHADNARVVLVLRDKGEETITAPWVSNVCEVVDGAVWVGTVAEWNERREARDTLKEDDRPEGQTVETAVVDRTPVVQLNNVSIAYDAKSRKVLDGVDWTIRPGDRWHLQGSNGSGKTTLLSVLLGHHPQSYSLPASALTLFSKPRRDIATPVLRASIGHLSPEIFAAFPRNMGLTAAQAIHSGYEGVFARRDMTEAQKKRILYLLDYFSELLATPVASGRGAGSAATPAPSQTDTRALANKDFAHYLAPQQALLVFLRAVVARPPLLVLDEPTQGMDEKIWNKCSAFLAKEWEEMRAEGLPEQAVICVSHYEDEVPWKDGKILRLNEGRGTVL